MLLLAVACTTAPIADGSTTSDPEVTDPTVPGTTTPPLTYYADVQPILDAKCARCHSDAGIVTSFDDPAAVVALAPTIRAFTESGKMPPPAPDPECRDYEGSDRFVLTAEEQAVLSEWAETGAALGDAASAAERSPIRTLAPFDLEVYATDPYTPVFSDGMNDYRCFVLDVENPGDVFMTGMEALVDNPRIVHHVVLFEASERELDPWGDDIYTGFDCDGFGEDGWDFLGGWAPGGEPLEFPEGYGIRLKRESHLVLQMHYFNAFDGAGLEVDQSGYGLLLADEVPHEVSVLPMGAFDFTIPAGEESYDVPMIVPWDGAWGEVEILGVFPHMHQLAIGQDMFIAHQDATQTCLVDLNGWDFHNQVNALFKESTMLRDGDILYINCMYDNSATNPSQYNDPPEDVEWGEGTDQEMCFGFTYGEWI